MFKYYIKWYKCDLIFYKCDKFFDLVLMFFRFLSDIWFRFCGEDFVMCYFLFR